MKAIKKVEVTPIDLNIGKIIDSFNTTDDKTKNAPSLHAVENYVENYVENNSILSENIAVITGSIADIPYGEQRSKRIYPPAGFTADNSVIVSVMTGEAGIPGDVVEYYGPGGISTDDYVRLCDDIFGWTVYITNSYGGSGTMTINYKVTIMKVS